MIRQWLGVKLIEKKTLKGDKVQYSSEFFITLTNQEDLIGREIAKQEGKKK